MYNPPTDEVWHSDARFRQLEDQVVDLTAALAQARKKATPDE